MKPYDFSICSGGLQRANFLAALAVAAGSLLSGGASAIAGLGSGVLSGVGGLASGIGGTASSLIGGAGGMASGIGGAASGIISGGASVLGGVTSATVGASKSLVDILATGSGQAKTAAKSVLDIYQMFNPPEQQITQPARTGTIQTPRIGIPTLATTLPQQQQSGQKVFTTPITESAAKLDYLPFIAMGGFVLFLFLRKK